jgi:CheY-like chemotaxis protein
VSPLPALNLSVLVVDDNRDVAESTAVLLRMAGCDTHVVYDGNEALHAMARVRPDAVLLDIGLPRMNGYEVAERIRAEPDYRRTLIVAVSGYGQEEHRLQSQRSGFDYHIVKPIDPPLLTGLLASLWSHRSAAAPENVVSFPARRTVE